MLKEAIALETLRQTIEDMEYESGDRANYLDYAKPTPAQAKQANELIEKLKEQSKAARAELKQLIATVRSQQPQALEEWVNYHIGILQKIVDEKTDAAITPRKNLAKETIQNWEKVRAGEMEFVNINWHFLKDYKASVRSITGRSLKTTDNASQSKAESKVWWQFWK